MSVNPDTRSEQDLHRYMSYTKKRALETATRHQYEATRQERIKQNEYTAESRKSGLMEIFESVDKGSQLRKCSQSGKPKTTPLGNATNTSKALNVTRVEGFVTKTEIVPMLPCKGYTLPHRNLFIGGKWPALDVNEWRYEVFGLERLRDETMKKIYNISTLQHEHERSDDQQGEPSDGSQSQSQGFDVEDSQSQTLEQKTFIFTQEPQGLCHPIPLKVGNNFNKSGNGPGWEDGILWDSGPAYL
ncbi:hypothetical protein P167DRAFT_569355 [Morchella conica CCBAS932]|uniref:Uncharacterized protein n=1 Tax=Morchella conica CCBAS932 TaxID=1392247 RepID=A0A3N4L3Y2_9PEZI|nr:hypothetical protein P167DRAFT_569355 [Morchella conica CCBAS932]